MDITELDKSTRKKLLYDLSRISNREFLEEKYDVNIPSSMFISYLCPICNRETSIRKLTNDILDMSFFMKCKECNEGTAKASYITGDGRTDGDNNSFRSGLGRFF